MIHSICYMKEGVEYTLETWPKMDQVINALVIVNQHEADNGRPEKFYLVTKENTK